MKTHYKFELYWKCCFSGNGYAPTVEDALRKARQIAEKQGELKDFSCFVMNPETHEFFSFDFKKLFE
jgi:hypothetical protein